MQLLYNGVDLAQLGTLRILSHTSQREPVEAPQRARVTYTVRLDFFEQTFANNFTLVEQMRNALKTQSATLLWKDSNGSTYLNRTVTAGDDQSTDEALNRGGSRWQAVTFHFWFYEHDLTTNCLVATYKRAAGSSETETLNFGAVEKYSQRLNISRWDDLRDGRKHVQGAITASGRFQGDTTTDLSTRRTALQAIKDKFNSEIAAGPSGTLAFGSFNKAVRITDFQTDIDQPNNSISWSLTATYTIYPNEADYAVIEVRIAQRQTVSEGIRFLSLSGRVGSSTAAAARARLVELQGSLVPAGYILLSTETTEPQTIVESGKGGGNDTGDGLVVTEISFALEYRDTAGISCTYKRTGSNTAAQDLGTVDKFREGYSGELFDDMRSNRKRAGGTVTIGGNWYVPDAMADIEKQKALVDKKNAYMVELVRGASGQILYKHPDTGQVVFNETVRVLDFTANINRLRCVEWSVTASFTRFPNEANYAVCEFRMATRQDRLEGIKTLTLNGRIGAQTEVAALAKLTRLRASVIPAGYVLKVDGTESRQVDCESDGAAVDGGLTFIEITINDEWQQVSGDVLASKLRRTDEDDVKAMAIRTTFSGTVQARGSTAVIAFATAEARAAELGDSKYPFRVRTSVTEVSNQVLTTGDVIVTVEFAYEYQRKGDKIYTEVTAELSEEAFGNSVESVSGYIQAPTLALAMTTYAQDVRNVAAYANALLLNERRPTLAEQRLDGGLGFVRLASIDDRYTFNFQVLRPKSTSQTAIAYDIAVSNDVQRLEKRTVIQGTVYAANEIVAEAFLTSFLTGLGIGVRVRFDRRPRTQRGPKISGGVDPASVLVSYDFSEEWVAILTGLGLGILETECAVELTYSGDRLVERPIPDGPPIIQKPGKTGGRRVVTARALATTETTAVAWVKSMRTALLTGGGGETFEAAPQIRISFRFLPQRSGVPRGGSSNVQVCEATGTFMELLPEFPYV